MAADTPRTGDATMSEMTRRQALGALAAAAATAACERTAVPQGDAAKAAAGAPKFFTPHEYETVKVLADIVIPRDERSGSATEAGVPEFMDFMLADAEEGEQVAMRGGLAWLDAECRSRFTRPFLECAEAERLAVVNDIAWPAKARPEMSHGAAFFNRFRDRVASGFWSSKVGADDLQYKGNVFVAEWKGCPDAVLQKLHLPSSTRS